MLQVLLHPCVHHLDPKWEGGCGPQCDGAPDVDVTCWPSRENYHRDTAGALRMPENWWIRFSGAAERAINSLDMAPILDHPTTASLTPDAAANMLNSL